MAKTIQGSGLGYRRDFKEEFQRDLPPSVDFLELAPENWINVGGHRKQELALIHTHYPIVCHGLSLSLGGPNPLDKQLLQSIKDFLNHYQIDIYTEHLSYCSGKSHLYNLFPLPFTEEAVKYVGERIKQVQDHLERPIAVENISYYAVPSSELTEVEFINQIIADTQCQLLLDVNNVYVNSQNHGYDPVAFIKQLDNPSIPYIHIAGHFQKNPSLIIDTHGDTVIDPVWDLLSITYEQFGPLPTLLERDNNLPPLSDLLEEVALIKSLQEKSTIKSGVSQ